MVESNSTGNMSNTNPVVPSLHITNETRYMSTSNRTSSVVEGTLSLIDGQVEHTTATPDKHHQQ